ncbi:hypothetical protein QP810_10015 [Streptococcus agalactiae]|uniref:hypothetical protein n=1 Tax=Streptococcus agalactiae TaxID=1311 RepID=UPI002553C95B|nr:hypothetical protein [Streptococcus agalactiae]MDK8747559.1 hypothetical protein [Streptococcus agalactiae]
MSNNKFEYKINPYSEKAFKKDGTPMKLSASFLAAREVSRAGGVHEFLDMHYNDRRHSEWQQEDPFNHDLSLEEVKELERIEEEEKLGNMQNVFLRNKV